MTFPIEKLCFWDFETRCDLSLKTAGTYAYAQEADAIILTYGIGDAPVQLIQKQGTAIDFADYPDDLKAAVLDPDVKMIAFNSPFDRPIHNYAVPDSPYLAPERTLDAMAQAMASNLPPALDRASQALHGPGKQVDGKKLINMFCGKNATDPKDKPEEWNRFCQYAVRDTAILRDVWKQTRALPLKEWRVFWANEALCERGMMVDLDFCRAASKLADEAAVRAGIRLKELTGGAITSVNQHIAIAKWVWNRLTDEEAKEIMITAVVEPEERGEDDEALPSITKISIARSNVERLLDWFTATKQNDTVLKDVLELREFGASAAPRSTPPPWPSNPMAACVARSRSWAPLRPAVFQAKACSLRTLRAPRSVRKATITGSGRRRRSI